MLELLSLRKGTTLTKEMFLNHLYGGMDEPELKIIDVFICKLRKKLSLACERRELHRDRLGPRLCAARARRGRAGARSPDAKTLKGDGAAVLGDAAAPFFWAVWRPKAHQGKHTGSTTQRPTLCRFRLARALWI